MIQKDQFVDFIYIGAPRAGSTWLAAALSEHPQIWIPHNKEIHFFNKRSLYSSCYTYPRGISFYREYFKGAPPDTLLGDISPLYYFDPDTAPRIAAAFPHVKILAILRNPVNVVFSEYLKRKTLELREPTFEQEIKKNPHILDLGYYFRLLKPYFENFPGDNICIKVYESFFENQEKSIQSIYGFLGVDDNFMPAIVGKRINAAKNPGPPVKTALNGLALSLLNTPALFPIKHILHKLKINRINYSAYDNQQKPVLEKLSCETRKNLMEKYEPEISQLENFLNVDLKIWREKQ
ncbi:MAG: hypothetical protein GF350_03065 [Chitinivibrionales bacterium]|nr:hypothetical protein [Chitinivibrionales bacterium]